MKRAILAALVFHTCITEGFTRSNAEVANLLQLKNNGKARGDDYVRTAKELWKEIDIDMNSDRLVPHYECMCVS